MGNGHVLRGKPKIGTIKSSTKSIPYSGAERGAETDYDFKPLKGRPDEAATIPEVQDNDALKFALVKINNSSTPFFTVGCGISINSEPGGFWAKGYLEFSFNYIEIAKDSPNYFLLFEQFNNYVRTSGFNLPVDFNFQLEGAHFSEIAADGHTATVWITTAEFPAKDDAHKTWNQSIGLLADFLGSFEKPPLTAIYAEE
jgi:hypothetical protein